MHACVAKNVGTQNATVLAYAKNLRHVTPPYITKSLLKDCSNLTGQERKSLRMGSTDYYLHVLSAKGVYFLCITEGRTIANPEATYGFLEELKDSYDDGKYTLPPDGQGMQADGGVRSAMRKWNDPNVMITARLKNQLSSVTSQLNDTLASLTTRGEKLQTLLDQSDDLAKASKEVAAAAESVYYAMLWRVWKWYLLYFLAFCILIGIIVAGICGSGNC